MKFKNQGVLQRKQPAKYTKIFKKIIKIDEMSFSTKMFAQNDCVLEVCKMCIRDRYMTYLRRKIDHDFDKKLLHTIRGAGWVLREEA